MSLSFKEAWDIFQKSIEAAHKLWAYFMTVSLATAGYVVGWDKIDWSSKMYLAIAIAYIVFAIGNRKVLRAAQREVMDASALVQQVQQSLPQEAPERILRVSAVNESLTGLFHLTCTIMVVIAIAVTWWDKCNEQACPKSSSPIKETPAADVPPGNSST